eukprot:CAMPEP_0176421916 /NCGR_PEP_ID=MMETSP0127-20121128/9447_1 /TAXON_ID=938130 /ORGANISM="Platyophrya macrostoma, Strain WH" /LENGTH=888 /DNA_ID=CAMNT_0017802715 /DNA_START=25 /DNA_END=2691 /DNA_ORIENTATION=+
MLSKMSKIMLVLLSLALLASAFDASNQKVARLLEDPESKNVTFQTTLISSELADIIWCGEQRESVLVVTEGGVVYRSSNGGLEWIKLKNIFQKAGNLVSDDEEVGSVTALIQSPVDHQVVFFLGSEGIHWFTEDCGRNIKALDVGKNIHLFQFHPIKKDWLLASAFTVCDEKSDKPCKTSHELYLSQDMGTTWTLIADYVIQFAWAAQDASFLQNIPVERIIITQDLRTKYSQKLGPWAEEVHMVYSDDFFKTKKVVLSRGQKFLITKDFFFVVRVEDEAKQDVSLYVSDPKGKKYKFSSISLPSKDKFYERSYVILDTSEGQVFLHINHENVRSKYGNIYISDSTGLRYSLSLRNNVRTEDDLSDFESVMGLEGIFLANIYDSKMVSKIKSSVGGVEVPNEKSSKRSGKSRDKGSRPTENRMNELDEFKQTRISFDKGGMWSPLTPPKKDALGEVIECEDKVCSLHLHSMSNGRYGPFYSTDNSLGLIMGTGNVGPYLSNKEDEINTYLSRDGGLTWYEIIKGSHIYEIGDHGSLIIVANDQKAVKNIFYTWNEGLSWHTLDVSETPIEITNIITEPSNTAQKFILYGRTAANTQDSKGVVKARKGVLIGIDFSSMHERTCVYPDKPNDDISDYETWSPHGHIVDDCLMGHKITYVRRKRQAECFNPQEFDKIYDYKNCQCTEEDWECDLGYERTKDDGPCVLSAGKEISYEPPEECDGYYTISSGYRKVAGNTCEGGVNHEAMKFPCPSKILSKKSAIILFGLTIAGIAVWLISNKTGDIKSFLNSKKNSFSKPINMKEFKKLGQDENAEGNEDHEDLAEKIKFQDDLDNPSPIQPGGSGKRMTGRGGLETASKNIPALGKPQEQQKNIMHDDDDDGDIGGFDPRT